MNNNIKNDETKETGRRPGRLYRVSGNLLICKTTSRACPNNFVSDSRSGIVQFTAGSSQRMRRYLRECMAEYSNMVTLTYPGFFESNGVISKEHLRRFLQELKRKVEFDNASISTYSTFWFLEFQARGAPHYHLFTTHYFPKDWVSKTWYRIVNSEDPRHLAAGTRCEKLSRGRSGTISYAQKYANKQIQKVAPEGYSNVGRFWGVSGYRATMSADTFVTADDRKSEHVQNIEKAIVKRVERGIWEATAEVFKREYGVVVILLFDKKILMDLKLLITRLSAQTMRFSQVFQDAELNIEE